MSTKKSIKNPNVRAASIKKRQSIISARKLESKSLDISKTQLRVILEELKAASREPSSRKSSSSKSSSSKSSSSKSSSREPSSSKSSSREPSSSKSSSSTVYSETNDVQSSKKTSVSSDSKKSSESSTVLTISDVEDVCKEHEKLLEKRKILNAKIREKNKECEETKYSMIEQYFGENKMTHIDLLSALFNLYKSNPETHYDRIYFQDFIRMFKRDTTTTLNFRRQHVFEAICRLLLLFSYDNEFGTDKTFYKSLEQFHLRTSPSVSMREILNTDINESSAGGVIDIFFEIKSEHKQKSNCKDGWACDCVIPISGEKERLLKRTFILIQNKYFDKEKNPEKDYDLSKIFNIAEQKFSEHSDTCEYYPILMVNNKEALDSRIRRAKRHNDIDIFGVKEMEDWFFKLLSDFDRFENIDDFLTEKTDNTMCSVKKLIVPLFHQNYITRTTFEYNIEQQYKLFIWGAVPRSGKSFIIGNFITQNYMRNEDERNNDIILILGAKTETESQFYTMFDDCSISNHYNIIKGDDRKKKFNKPKSIYILSQEWFKTKKIEEKEGHWLFTKEVHSKYPQLFLPNKRVDIIFDEVHKGGTTDRSQKILDAFNGENIKIDLFIMVTATFAKPSIRYNTNFIDEYEKGTKIIEWGYEDQQSMKQLNETKKTQIINNKKTDEGIDTIESNNIKIVFDEYERRYGKENYLHVISEEYSKHPELVIFQPEIQDDMDIDFQSIFIGNLKCDACDKTQSISNLQDPSNIFEDRGRVDDLIDFIGNVKENRKLDSNCVYSKLLQMKAPVGIPHSELWFLPDKDLYLNESDESCKLCNNVKNEDNQDEDKVSNKSKPNIEPLTRGLAFLIMEHSYFRKKYNILIVHNTVLSLVNNETKNAYSNLFQTNIRLFNNKEGLSSQIKQFEHDTFQEGKSLIILTGAKLRLGISLPCVDIAFNFDNIKSVDNNYQTMFRVLTERTNRPKKYGYYVDFNKERSIQFLYDYNNTYGSGKIITNIKEKTERLQKLLLLFNYNGLGLIKRNAIQETKIYDKLITTLRFDQQSYQAYMLSKNGIYTLITKSLIYLNYELIQNIKDVFKSYNINKSTVKIALKDGKKSKHDKIPKEGEGKGEGEGEGEEPDEVTDEISDQSLSDILAEILPIIPALLSLFSINKTTLFKSIQSCISDLHTKTDENMCSSENIHLSNIFACYMKINNLNRISLIRLLESTLEILNHESSRQLSITLNIIFDNIRDSMSKYSDALILHMSAQDIQDKIEQYLPIRKKEKEQYGEVFTPISLIDEVMDEIPESVWKNPELTWLDPANGIGNFPMIVYARLMTYLPEKYNNNGIKYSTQSGKSRHILSKMIFMCEINPTNVKISQRIFGSDSNICCCNFLEEEHKWKTQFGRSSFDIIIGNPPFNYLKENGSIQDRHRGNRRLWDQFITKSLELLNKNGFLGFITPPGWRKPRDDELYNKMTKECQLLYLHIYGKKQSEKLFHVSQRVDLYVIEKTPHYKLSNIVDELGEKHRVDTSTMQFIPNYQFDIIQKLLTDKEHGIHVIYDTFYHASKLPKEKTEKNKYPVVHTINVTGIKSGIRYASDKTKGHFGIPKVLLNFNEVQYPVNDYEGKYGMSELTFGIPISSKKQGDEMVRAINTPEFKEIVKATKWTTFQTDRHMFKYFKPDFYKYFLDKTTAATKIQAVTRGKQTRKKHNTTKKGGNFKRSKRMYNKLRITRRRHN